MSHPEPGRREHAPAGNGLLAGLTHEQAQAVMYGPGPLLLIAGPGAGKTRALTRRGAHRGCPGRIRRQPLGPGSLATRCLCPRAT
jgi:UvrD-like helicase family protein